MNIDGKAFFMTGKKELEKAWAWLQHNRGKLYNFGAEYVVYRDPEHVMFWYGTNGEGIDTNKILTKEQFLKEFEHIELAEDWGMF
jgi:hypothetical protein